MIVNLRAFFAIILLVPANTLICGDCRTENCGQTASCSGRQPHCGLFYDRTDRTTVSFALTRCHKYSGDESELPLCLTFTDAVICICNTDRCNEIRGFPNHWPKFTGSGSPIGVTEAPVPVPVPGPGSYSGPSPYSGPAPAPTYNNGSGQIGGTGIQAKQMSGRAGKGGSENTLVVGIATLALKIVWNNG